MSEAPYKIDPRNRLYHYRSYEVATKYILPNLKLRLSPIFNTNDPKENKTLNFGATSWPGTVVGNFAEKNIEICKIIRSDCKTLCFSDDDQFFGFELSRMWALYGENHKGLCLGLDKNAFLAENASLINTNNFKRINYKKYSTGHHEPIYVDHTIMQQLGEEKYLKETFRIENLDYLFFTKSNEWESENEVRLIHFSNNEYEYCSIKNSLKNIFLGVDFDSSKLDELITICPHVDIHQLEFHDYRFGSKRVYTPTKAH